MAERRLAWRRLRVPMVAFVVLGTGVVGCWLGLRALYPTPFRSFVVPAAQNVGIDPRLVYAVIRSESRFRTDAVSRAGAIGLMQITPSTGAWIARERHERNFSQAQLFDGPYNVASGTWYLAHLLVRFHGQVPLVLAAYNAGTGTVERWLSAGTWNGAMADSSRIPYPETRQFVQRTISAYVMYRRMYRAESGNTPIRSGTA